MSLAASRNVRSCCPSRARISSRASRGDQSATRPSHRTVRTDLVYGSCILTSHYFVFINADGASQPVFTFSISYKPSSSNQLFGIAKLDKGLLEFRHEFILMNLNGGLYFNCFNRRCNLLGFFHSLSCIALNLRLTQPASCFSSRLQLAILK